MRTIKTIKTIMFVSMLGFTSVLGACKLQQNTATPIIFTETFNQPLQPNIWHIEMDSMPNSTVQVENGQLVIDTKAGVTVWLNKELNNHTTIEFDRTIVVENGINDRLSDMNQFWLATDPHQTNLFTRNGKFEAYDSLSLYYVGIGGNYNKTTRFRRYWGDGKKPILVENNTSKALLQPNKTYHIKIEINGTRTRFWIDRFLLFDHIDEDPLTHGYFGFRSTWSRQTIDNLKIHTTQQ